MKKSILFLFVLFFSAALIAQETDIKKEKKDNMGQTVSEVNAEYRNHIKALKTDESLSKADRKTRKKELKQMKRNRIREIKENAGKNHDHKMDADKGKKKDHDMDDAKGKKEMKEKKAKAEKN